VLTNATMIRESLSSIGLEINNSKCELLLINHTDINIPKQASSFKTNSHPSLYLLHSLAVTRVPPAPGICPTTLKSKNQSA